MSVQIETTRVFCKYLMTTTLERFRILHAALFQFVFKKSYFFKFVSPSEDSSPLFSSSLYCYIIMIIIIIIIIVVVAAVAVILLLVFLLLVVVW